MSNSMCVFDSSLYCPAQPAVVYQISVSLSPQLYTYVCTCMYVVIKFSTFNCHLCVPPPVSIFSTWTLAISVCRIVLRHVANFLVYHD